MSKLNTFKINYTGSEINQAIGAVLAGNVGSSGGIEYTVNGQKADSTGNFIVNGDTTLKNYTPKSSKYDLDGYIILP